MQINMFEPITGERRSEVSGFLEQQGIAMEADLSVTVVMSDDDQHIVATGSLERNVIKCVAVSPSYRGGGLMATVISMLVHKAIDTGQHHLFIFTKPENWKMFSGLGFYTVEATQDVLLMENKRDGIQKYAETLQHGVAPSMETSQGVIGSAVVNCNPFTNGHLYLIERAAAMCSTLHVFVLSENQSEFSAQVRWDLVQKGVSHIQNVCVHPTSDYIVSSATFPTYFHKDRRQAETVNCELDLKIFARFIAKPLGITRRFVGTEPYCMITQQYNRQMKALLPQYGIEVIELERYSLLGMAVSASRVRQLLAQGKMDDIRKMVPMTTYEYLQKLMRHESQQLD